MSQVVKDPEKLVMTQAEAPPPPDVTVPEPPEAGEVHAGADPQVLLEVKALADRVGGLEKLRDLVGALIRIRA